MAPGIPARLTVAQGRRFGLTVGIAFVALGAVAAWRGHPTTATVLWSIGGVLILAGLFIPRSLGPVERAWMGLAHLISKVTTPIFMGVVYFIVLAPVGLIMRLFGRNPVVHREAGGGFWAARSEPTDPARMRNQF